MKIEPKKEGGYKVTRGDKTTAGYSKSFKMPEVVKHEISEAYGGKNKPNKSSKKEVLKGKKK